MQSIQDIMQEIGSDMAFLDDMAKIEYLVDISKKAPGLPPELKDEQHKVYGCASETWLNVEEKDGKIFITSDSDTAIVRGLLQLLERCFNGHTKEEITAVDGQQVLNTIGLGGSITNRRMNGFASAIAKIQRIVGEMMQPKVDG